ncbi:hypothetical protein [Zhongshania aliphaticivorans]|jgi:hypothetical protein|uniref:hypothetical protein n=1 Tax=Zhongshania aliphaticivorans TaxID=1470434 RepID=UPI0039C8F96D
MDIVAFDNNSWDTALDNPSYYSAATSEYSKGIIPTGTRSVVNAIQNSINVIQVVSSLTNSDFVATTFKPTRAATAQEANGLWRAAQNSSKLISKGRLATK